MRATGSEAKRWKGEGFIVAIKGNARKERQRSPAITLCHATSTSLWPQVYRCPLLYLYPFLDLFLSLSSHPSASRIYLPSYHLRRYLFIGALSYSRSLAQGTRHSRLTCQLNSNNWIDSTAVVVPIIEKRWNKIQFLLIIVKLFRQYAWMLIKNHLSLHFLILRIYVIITQLIHNIVDFIILFLAIDERCRWIYSHFRRCTFRRAYSDDAAENFVRGVHTPRRGIK